MDKLEVLALAESPAASRELAAMQALALKLADTDTTNPRLRSLARTLERDLEAALAGKAAPWGEARTRFEARKLARLAPADAAFEDTSSPASDSPFAGELADTEENAKRALIVRLAIAAVAFALWALWIGSLGNAGQVAWDGGTGPAQTLNLVTLYAPAVIALLFTLIAITPSDRLTQS